MFTLTVFITCALLSASYGYPNGAGTPACTDSVMSPEGHHADSKAMTTATPYTVTLSASSYKADDTVTVTVEGTTTKYIEGFLVLALPADNDKGVAVGSFEIYQNENGTELSRDRCSGGSTHTMVFHDIKPHPAKITLTWKAPSSPTGDVKFHATVVKSLKEYWVKTPSETLTLGSGAGRQSGFTLTMLSAVLCSVLLMK